MLDGLVFLADVSARLAGLLHPAVPTKNHSNHHRCCLWLMVGECIRQPFVRHVKDRVE
jgi:hypothetical protein